MDDAALFAAFAARFPQFGGTARQSGLFCTVVTFPTSFFQSLLRAVCTAARYLLWFFVVALVWFFASHAHSAPTPSLSVQRLRGGGGDGGDPLEDLLLGRVLAPRRVHRGERLRRRVRRRDRRIVTVRRDHA